MAIELTALLNVKDKGFRNQMAKNLMDLKKLTKNEWAVRVAAKEEGFDGLKESLDYFNKDNGQIDIQMNYNLVSATVDKAIKEIEGKLNLASMLESAQNGGDDLSRYIEDIVFNIQDAIDDDAIDDVVRSKYKQLKDLVASMRQYKDQNGRFLHPDQMAQDAIKDIDPEFASLNYKPSTSFFEEIKDQILEDQSHLDKLKSSMEEFIKMGETPIGVGDGNGIKQNDTISYFDGIHEQVLDAEKDADKIDALLDELASKWEKVGFRSASDFFNSKGRVTDNLYLQLSGGASGPSLGSGTYFSQNFKDISQWADTNGDVRKLFAADLSGVENMLKVSNDEFLEQLADAMQNIHALIAKDIFPNENYSVIQEDTGTFNVDDLINNYSEVFQSLHISGDFVRDFISRQSEWLNTMKTSSEEIPEELKKAESFYSKFIKEALGVSGVDASNLGTVDSSDFGTVIYERLAESLPHIDFGNNKELAQKFAEKVFDKILLGKAQNPDVDLEEVFKSYTGVKTRDFLSGDISQMAKSSFYSEESLTKFIDTLQRAKEIQKEAQSLSIDQLNQGLFKQDTDSVQEYIQRIERVRQLQQTVFNMKPNAAFGKSYEEIGGHIEKLNAEYEQTIAEIDKLKESGDNSPAIQEQIGLLSNLALAYQDAIERSFPNDVSRGDWLRKYTDLNTKDLWGDETLARFDKIQQKASEFTESLHQEELDLYRAISNAGGDTSLLSEDNINTSALEEIPSIMDRITNAGKEVRQTLSDVGDSITTEGRELDTSLSSEVERLERENQELQDRNDQLYKDLENEQINALSAWNRMYDAERSRDQTESELNDANRIIDDKNREIDELRSQLSQTSRKTEESESQPFTEIGDTALGATEAKNQFATANENVAQSVGASIPLLLEEARAFKEVAEMASQAASQKDGFNQANKEVKAITKASEKQVNKKAKDPEPISWRASTIKSGYNALTKAVGNSPELTALYGSQIDEFQKKIQGITSKTTNGEFDELAAGIRNVTKAVNDINADKITQAFQSLTKDSRDIRDFLNDGLIDEGRAGAIKSFADQFEVLRQRVKEVGSVFGEDSDEYKKASQALNNYTQEVEDYVKSWMQAHVEVLDQRFSNSEIGEDQAEQAKKAEESIESMRNIISGFNFDDVFNVDKLNSFIQSMSAASDATKDFQQKTNDLATETQVNKLFDKVNRDIQKNHLSGDLLDQFTNLRTRLREIAEDTDDVADGFVKISKSDFKGLVTEWTTLHRQMIETGQEGKTFFDRVGEAMTTQGAAFIARYFSFQDYIRYARELIQTVTTLDTSLKELQKLTGASDSVMAQSFQHASETAQQYGATINSVLDSTSDWRRLGYSLSESEDLAKVTTLYQNIANGIDQQNASEYMVSILQGFQIDASDSLKVVDAINEVSQNFAIDQQGVGESLQRSAAAFNAAHTDLNKSIALVTASNEVLQDPAKSGTMWNTLAARIRGASTE